MKMNRFEKEITKWVEQLYRERTETHAGWMIKKENELEHLDQSTEKFELEMENSAKQMEKWLEKRDTIITRIFLKNFFE